MSASKRVLAILLGVMVIAMVSGCAADEPEFAEGQAIGIVVDNITELGTPDGQRCLSMSFNESYIGDGVWTVWVGAASGTRSVSWKVYENSLLALTMPSQQALRECYSD